MAYNLLVNGVYWGYNQLTNLLLTSWDVQVSFFDFSFRTNNPTSVKNSLAHRFCWGWKHTATGYLTVHGSKCGSFELRWHHHLKIGIVWVVPPPSNSHHQDYIFNIRDPKLNLHLPQLLGAGTTQGIVILLSYISSFPCHHFHVSEKTQGGHPPASAHLKTKTLPHSHVAGSAGESSGFIFNNSTSEN